jgi:hypothetical protein
MRKLFILVAVALLALPAAAQAKPGHGPGGLGKAAHACRAERQSDVDAFKQKYGNERGRRAFARCVRQHLVQARQTCRTERQTDVAAFQDKYGNNRGRRAFPRCVRQHAADPVA